MLGDEYLGVDVGDDVTSNPLADGCLRAMGGSSQFFDKL